MKTIPTSKIQAASRAGPMGTVWEPPWPPGNKINTKNVFNKNHKQTYTKVTMR
jgi:hypothetical protein